MSTTTSAIPTTATAEQAPGPLLLTDCQAAELLGVSRSHFRELVRTGRAPEQVKLGRAARWRRDELQAWIAAGLPPSH